MKKINFSSRLQYGTITNIIIVGFLVLVFVLNSIITVALEKYPITIDLTRDGIYGITDQTVDYLEGNTIPVTITVLLDEQVLPNYGYYYNQAYEILKSYTHYGSSISLQFYDLAKNPQLASMYSEYNLYDGDILVQSDMRTKKISVNDLFYVEQNTYGEQRISSVAEQYLTSAIMYVCDTDVSSVGLLYTETNVVLDGIISLLSSNNYEMSIVNLLTEDISDQFDFVILPQPATDLSADQVKKLNTYLDNNGEFSKSLMFVASSTNTIGATTNNFLAEWGIQIGTGFVAQTNLNLILGTPYAYIAYPQDYDITPMLTNPTFPIYAAGNRPIELLFESSDNRSTSVILQTELTAIITPEELPENFDANTIPQQSYPLIVKGTREKYEGYEALQSHVIVFSSDSIIADYAFVEPSMNNAELTIAISNFLVDKELSFVVAPKIFDQLSMIVTADQVRSVFIVFMGVIPLAVLITGVFVWLRRRHL